MNREKEKKEGRIETRKVRERKQRVRGSEGGKME